MASEGPAGSPYLLAAFHRGWADDAIMRGVDLLISLPPVLLGLLREEFRAGRTGAR